MVYGYIRVSTKTQSLERQRLNIERYNSQAVIFAEKVTGTKLDIRKEFNKLLTVVKSGDTIIFDSVSRMSRNAEEAINLYEDLYEKGVNLIFLKERHIDTEVYRKACTNSDFTYLAEGMTDWDYSHKSGHNYGSNPAYNDVILVWKERPYILAVFTASEGNTADQTVVSGVAELVNYSLF